MSRPDMKARVCAVCAHVLEIRTDRRTGEVGWFHIRAQIQGYEDHLAVPALPTEIQAEGVCDFCSAPRPQWELPARDFQFPWNDLPVEDDHASRGPWACCGSCAQLIEANKWEALYSQCRRAFIAKHGPVHHRAWKEMLRLYELLRENVTGPVRPSVWPPVIEE